MEPSRAEFWSKISRRYVSRGQVGISIGGAALRAVIDGPVPPNATFSYSKWQPLVIGRIDVIQNKPHQWQHGATLWYMRLNEKAAVRWYEVS